MPWGRTDQYDSNDTPQLGIFDSTSSVVLYCEEKAYILVEKAFKIQIQKLTRRVSLQKFWCASSQRAQPEPLLYYQLTPWKKLRLFQCKLQICNDHSLLWFSLWRRSGSSWPTPRDASHSPLEWWDPNCTTNSRYGHCRYHNSVLSLFHTKRIIACVHPTPFSLGS